MNNKCPAKSFFSISALCFVSFFFVTLQSCKKYTSPTFGKTTNPAPNSQKKFLSLGDTYTIGESVPQTERFQNKPITILSASSINLKYLSQIIAKNRMVNAKFLK